MTTFPQALPSTATAAGTIARRLLTLKGPALQAPDGSLNAADALSLGASLEDARQVLAGARAQAFVCDATYMLDELEALYALPVDPTSTTASRQARLLAFVRATISGVPASIESAVASVTGTCRVVEYTAAEVYAVDPSPTAATRRNVFRFVVIVPSGFITNASKQRLVRSIVDRMKPAHTAYTLSAGEPLKFDTASGFDLTALGA